MSRGRYAPLPNSQEDAVNREMEDAFDNGEDDDERLDADNHTESHPLNPSHSDEYSGRREEHIESSALSASYDFEGTDFDYVRPPPGSPPRPTATALPNDHGNTNGLVPSFSSIQAHPRNAEAGSWFSRLWRPKRSIPSGPIGRGSINDGVFANVTAKPSVGQVVQEGDSIYVIPEETRAEAPPSYASAQADAVPQYWENTVHAPFSGGGAMGDMLIEALPTGSMFSFMWNFLISVSFQFVGFLLTYLLHTSHAARYGSRAGLGVTLIQYGFTLRTRASDAMVNSGEGVSAPVPTFATAAEAENYFFNHNSTLGPTEPGVLTPEEEATMMVADATTEWLSFFLMTVGWFILLTSLLGFWRVKRWERVLATSSSSNPAEESSSNSRGGFNFRQSFLSGGMPWTRFNESNRDATETTPNEGDADNMEAGFLLRHENSTPPPPPPPPPPPGADGVSDDLAARARRALAIARENRLREDLRAAGLL